MWSPGGIVRSAAAMLPPPSPRCRDRCHDNSPRAIRRWDSRLSGYTVAAESIRAVAKTPTTDLSIPRLALREILDSVIRLDCNPRTVQTPGSALVSAALLELGYVAVAAFASLCNELELQRFVRNCVTANT